MNHLGELVYGWLKEVYEEVYEEVASRRAGDQYIEYHFPGTLPIETIQENIILEVSVWDKNTDTTEINAIADLVKNKFHGLKHVDDKVAIWSHLEGRRPKRKGDPLLRGRELRFTLQVTFLEG